MRERLAPIAMREMLLGYNLHELLAAKYLLFRSH